jgi:hypothetical protein
LLSGRLITLPGLYPELFRFLCLVYIESAAWKSGIEAAGRIGADGRLLAIERDELVEGSRSRLSSENMVFSLCWLEGSEEEACSMRLGEPFLPALFKLGVLGREKLAMPSGVCLPSEECDL